MAAMDVSLLGPMKDWVEAHAREGRYGNASGYVRHLIRCDPEREAAFAALQAEIAAGLASGASRPLDREAIRARAGARHAGG